MKVVGYNIDQDSYQFHISRSDMDLISALVERNETYDKGLSNFHEEDREEFEAALAQAVKGENYYEISFEKDFFYKLKSMTHHMTYTYVPEDLLKSTEQRKELVERMKGMWPQMKAVEQQTYEDAEVEKLIREMGE